MWNNEIGQREEEEVSSVVLFALQILHSFRLQSLNLNS